MRRATDNVDDNKEEPHWFRSDRFFISDGMWFFSTREKASFGPFARFPDAMQSLKRYLVTQRFVTRVRGQVPELKPGNTFDANSVGLLAKDFHSSVKADSLTEANVRKRQKKPNAGEAHRNDDDVQKHFYQSERFFSVNRQWYFSTRETRDRGPFKSRAGAEQELVIYLKTSIGVNVDTWGTPGASN